MEILNNLFAFLTDEKRHISTKAATIVSAVIIITLANNLTGFTYYYNVGNKIDKLKLIYEVKKDTSLSVADRNHLTLIEREILNRKDLIETTSSFLSNTYDDFKNNNHKSYTHTQKPKNDITQSNNIKQIPTRNNFWFLITSSGVYILVTLATIPVLLISHNNDLGLNIVISIVVFLLMAGASWLNYFVFGLIPLILNNWLWNYIINAFLHIGVLLLISRMLSISEKNSKKI